MKKTELTYWEKKAIAKAGGLAKSWVPPIYTSFPQPCIDNKMRCEGCPNNPDVNWIVPKTGKFEGHHLCPHQDDIAEIGFQKYARFPKGSKPPFMWHSKEELDAIAILNPDLKTKSVKRKIFLQIIEGRGHSQEVEALIYRKGEIERHI